jgi:cytoskeletal protein RodZ
MKRCPECYETYSDQAKFCETDGHELLADPALAPKTAVDASEAKPLWWVGTALGVLIGVIFGAGVFAVTFIVSTPRAGERPDSNPTPEVQEKVVPHRLATASSSLPPEPEVSPSPDAKDQAEAEASPATTAENKTAPAAQLNEGPISTGQKSTPGDGEAAAQTVIEMTDGSKLDVDAAWEDKQGIWYRRSGLVSFVESSRVKSITARRDSKVTDEPHH